MVISGNVRPRKGYMMYADRRFDSLSARLAHRLGIEMVYQQVQLNTFFSVAENIFFLNKKLAPHGLLSQRSLVRRAQEFLDAGGFHP